MEPLTEREKELYSWLKNLEQLVMIQNKYILGEITREELVEAKYAYLEYLLEK